MLRILRYVKGSNLQVANLLILCSKIATKNFRLLRIFFFFSLHAYRKQPVFDALQYDSYGLLLQCP